MRSSACSGPLGTLYLGGMPSGSFGACERTSAPVACSSSSSGKAPPRDPRRINRGSTSASRISRSSAWTSPAYDPRTGRLPVEFQFFAFRGQRLLDRFDELHKIQTYSVPGMRALLRRGGFDVLGAFAATNVKKAFTAVTRDTFRVMAAARAKRILNTCLRDPQALPRKTMAPLP